MVRKLFNPNAISSWFKSVVAIINQISLLTVVLTGAAVIREREHGTLEHLLVMPLTAFEIAMAKVWANSLVILVATGASLFLVVQMVLKVPFAGSVTLWFVGVVLYLFFATALGIFLGTISRSMAQFALLIILVIVVLMLLSGGSTPVESQPKWLQYLTYLLPARHFVSFSQVIIYRGGGLRAVWLQFLMVSRGRPRRSSCTAWACSGNRSPSPSSARLRESTPRNSPSPYCSLLIAALNVSPAKQPLWDGRYEDIAGVPVARKWRRVMFDQLIDGVRKASESSLQMQQEMLKNWTRLFSGPMAEAARARQRRTGASGRRSAGSSSASRC